MGAVPFLQGQNAAKLLEDTVLKNYLCFVPSAKKRR